VTTLAFPKPERGSAKKARERERRRSKDRDYASWLHKQPCIVAGCPVEPEQHHERSEGFDGTDADSVPLCRRHHRGPHGRHGLRSAGRFEEHYNLSLRAHMTRLRALYEEEK
jgi:hypothetical protein